MNKKNYKTNQPTIISKQQDDGAGDQDQVEQHKSPCAHQAPHHLHSGSFLSLLLLGLVCNLCAAAYQQSLWSTSRAASVLVLFV